MHGVCARLPTWFCVCVSALDVLDALNACVHWVVLAGSMRGLLEILNASPDKAARLSQTCARKSKHWHGHQHH